VEYMALYKFFFDLIWFDKAHICERFATTSL